MTRAAEVFTQIWKTDNGMRVRFQGAVCGACGFTECFRDNHRTAMPPEGMAKHFRRAGWVLGARRNDDRCPRCVSTKRTRKAVRSTTGRPVPAPVFHLQEETPVPTPTADTAPRAATREENRRIRDELDACYDESAGRYVASWTDQAVADKLKVPRAFVSGVREDFYGPEGNEAQANRHQALEALTTELQGLIERGYALIADAEAKLADARKALAA
jgi:predicted nucleic-acid-binding Zn-ribbon protein